MFCSTQLNPAVNSIITYASLILGLTTCVLYVLFRWIRRDAKRLRDTQVFRCRWCSDSKNARSCDKSFTFKSIETLGREGREGKQNQASIHLLGEALRWK